MRSAVVALLLMLSVLAAPAQEPGDQPQGTLVLNEAVGVHLARAQVFEAALEAWTWTFGQQPGAHLDLQDRATGVIEGRARINFRSKELTGREESMGPVVYHVTIRTDNGHCTVQVGRIVHTGNHNAVHGGLDVGTIYSGDRPGERIKGISLKRTQLLHAEVRDLATSRISELLRAFAARLRQAGQP